VWGEVKDRGDPWLLVRGADAEGRICGRGTLDQYELAAWPDPTDWKAKVCVHDCSVTGGVTPLEAWDASARQAALASSYGAATPPDQYTTIGMFDAKQSSRPMAGYCVPDGDLDGGVEIKLSGDFASAEEAISKMIGDTVTTWPLLAGAVPVSLMIAFIYTFVLRGAASFLVWSMIFAAFLGGAFGTYALYAKGVESESFELEDDNRGRNFKLMAYVLGGLTIIYILIIAFLRQRINIAIEVTKEAAKAFDSMPLMVLFPVWPLIFGLAYIGVWLVLVLYIWSITVTVEQPLPSSEVWAQYVNSDGLTAAQGGTMEVHEWDSSLRNYAFYTLFHFFWTIQFFVYFTFMVVALSISKWYFTPYVNGKKGRGSGAEQLTSWPVATSCCTTLRFHLGTVALGALIIAVIKTIHAVITYVESKLVNHKENAVVRAIFCCMHCCLWAAECCMDKVNKNAFVWTAIFGTSFATSACNSFALVWRNLARVAAITVVGGFILFLGKVIVAALTAGIVGAILVNVDYYEERVYSIIVPCALAFVIAWIVASLFMTVLDTTIDTVFLCFLVDDEHNNLNGRQMYASESLVNLVGKFSKDSEEMCT
jgi:hypothetical protein